MTTGIQGKRSLIFISHATPQDNDFTLWLGARLACAGYTVWSDVTKLVGGETHWDNIETAIREHAAKVVSVCSSVSIGKKGFKDELSLALAVERQHNLTDFVIPIRHDDLAYSAFPAEIIRRNGVDFSTAWQEGLAKLIKKFELDEVPRTSSFDTDMLSAWSKSLLQIDSDISESEETLISNMLTVLKGPVGINIFKVKPSVLVRPGDISTWPAECNSEWIFSFSRLEISDPNRFQLFSQIELLHFLDTGGDAVLGLGRQDCNNIVSSLLRQAWERFARESGLHGQLFASGRKGYFLSAEDGGGKRTSFTGPTGIVGSRALNGFSPKNKVFWHYAPELLPVLDKSITFSVMAHVIFTEDGKTPITDSARAHRLRRRFCKNWWQDRWRDMMLAYLSHLAGGNETIVVPISETFGLTLSAHPGLYVCPVSATAPSKEPHDDEADDPAVDELIGDTEDDTPDSDEEEYS